MGQFGEYIKMALYNIKENKGRSFLTMLGIIIGISSVITIISIGNGLKEDVVSSTDATSTTVMVDAEEIANTEIITREDMQALRDQLGDRTLGVTSGVGASGAITTQKGRFDTYVTLTTPDAEADPAQMEVVRGSYFTEEDVTNGSLAAVVDKESALYLFGTDDVIGMEVDLQIENTIQTVYIKGVRDSDPEMMAANREAVSLLNMAMPTTMELPYTASENWGEQPENFSTITIYLADGENENAVAKSAIQLLAARHLNDGEDLFVKQQGMDMAGYMGTLLDSVTAFIAFVAGISLLVGGIGVMNIMLVSVTERTREIGIRKSLGAKTSSIVAQFLCESAIISGIGGVIGILIGAGISGIVTLTGVGGLSAHLSATAVILTTAFSCGVGIIFGIYPAQKAAKMSPIEALRQL